MAEDRPHERRKSDVDLSDIKVCMAKIEGHTKKTAALHDLLVKDVDGCLTICRQNEKDLIPLKTTQKIVVWGTRLLTMAGLGFLAKWYFKTH